MNNCSNCKWCHQHYRDEPCEICNSNFDMWVAKVDIKPFEHPLRNVDFKDIENLLQCLNEAITGLHWRMENDSTTMDDSNYDKYDEWITELKKYPREFWADCMLHNNEEDEIIK